MDEGRESAYFLKSKEKLFKQEPYMIYLTAFIIGVGCSAIFPDLAGLLHDRGYRGIQLANPHL